MQKRKYTDEQFIEAVKNSFSIAEALKTLGLVPAGGSYKVFNRRIKTLRLDISHFTGQGHLKGKTHNWKPERSLDEILQKGSYIQSFKLSKRLIKEGIIQNSCSRCEIHEWQGEVLSLHLDHIDGDNTNNELSNLRLLCPNCHSLTPTYCGKNKKLNNQKAGIFFDRKASDQKCNYKNCCIDCGVKVYREAKRCKKCNNKMVAAVGFEPTCP